MENSLCKCMEVWIFHKVDSFYRLIENTQGVFRIVGVLPILFKEEDDDV